MTRIARRDKAGSMLTNYTVYITPYLRYLPLLRQLTARDIAGRYRGSSLGLFWTFLTPLLLLSVYTFVFTRVFQARPWRGAGTGASDTGSFALLVFAGLIVHSCFSECLARAPGLISAHTNFVKKVVFPLSVLPLMAVATAFFHLCVGVAVLLLAGLVVQGQLPLTAFLFPLPLLPFLLLTLGVTFFLSALGVYLRDIGQVMGLFSTVLMFLSPVFYPVESLPVWLQPWMFANPLTVPILSLRALIIFGELPPLLPLIAYSGASLIIFLFGAFWFRKTRPGFADVL